jgi:crotonobetainyl-CoA:carnitine CoA-transferase CaiB-like acyl-CoA transferase
MTGPGLLDGVRVVEIGSALGAHFAGRLLGLLGADVIKVEPVHGDPSRRRGPFIRDVPHIEGSTLFLYANMCKRSVTANAATPTGRSLISKLVDTADAVIFDGNDSAWTPLSDLRKAERGRPIWVEVSAFGASGPHRDWTLSEVALYHAGGEGYLLPGGTTFLAYPDREPIKGPRYLGSFSAGVSIAVAALLALLDEVRGPGSLFIDVSLQECLLQLLRAEIHQCGDLGVVQSRAMRSLGVAGLLPSRDGWLELYPLEPRMWNSLMQLMGNPEWADGPDFFASARLGQAPGEKALENVGMWTAQRPKEETAQLCQEAGIAAGAVLTIDEALGAEQLAAREFFQLLPHPYAGELRYPVLPFGGNVTSAVNLRSAPLLGAHNVDVWGEVAAASGQDVCKMFEAGVI